MKQRAFQGLIIIIALAAVFGIMYIAAGIWDDSTVMIDSKTYSTGDRSLSLVLMTEDGLADISRFDRLESLDITPYKASARLAVQAENLSAEDAAKAMRQIDELYGSCTDVADIGFLAQSQTLPQTLRSLDLSYCAVSDLSVLSGFTSLETLDISHTAVTDLTPLMSLPALRRITVTGTDIDSTSLSAFEQRGYEYISDGDTAYIEAAKTG